MANEEKLIRRRELLRRIAMAGAVPAVVAVVTGTTEAQLSPPPASGSGSAPPPTPGCVNLGDCSPPAGPATPPVVTPEPGMAPLLLGLGAAAGIAVKLRHREKTDSGSDSNPGSES